MLRRKERTSIRGARRSWPFAKDLTHDFKLPIRECMKRFDKRNESVTKS